LDIYLDFSRGSVFTYKEDEKEIAGLKPMTLKRSNGDILISLNMSATYMQGFQESNCPTGK